MIKRRWLGFAAELAGVFLLVSAFLYFVMKTVPFDMDELVSYHSLACLYYPFAKLNVFRESCNCYDLALLGGPFLPLRSFEYVGNVQGLFYYPLFCLWKSPHSVRLFGIFSLLAQGALLCKLFRTRFFPTFLFLIFFMPYAFQHAVDFGSISFHATSVFLIFLIAKKWAVVNRAGGAGAWVYPILAGMTLFICVWIKLSYLFLLPAVLLLILYTLWEERNLGWSAALFMVSWVLPTYGLLTALSRDGQKYFKVLFVAENNRPWTLLAWVTSFRVNVLKYLTNPLLSTHVIFKVKESWTVAGVCLVSLVIAFFIYGLKKGRLESQKKRWVWLNLVLFLITLCSVGLSRRTWAMHHAVLSFPFLILAIFTVVSSLKEKRVVLIFLAAFAVLNTGLYFQITRLDSSQRNHEINLVKLNEHLNNASNQYAFICIDWGFYYIKSLYGNKHQVVLYAQPLTAQSFYKMQVIREILTATHRKAMFIGLNRSVSDYDFIRRSFPDLARLKLPFDTGDWVVRVEP